jgi:hypothetical protein
LLYTIGGCSKLSLWWKIDAAARFAGFDAESAGIAKQDPAPSINTPPSHRNRSLYALGLFRQTAVQFLVQDLVCRILIESLAAVMIVVVAPAIVIAIVATFAVPAMVVFDSAAAAIPIACKVLLSIMTRLHPASALVSRTGPVSVVPSVVVAIGVPIAAYPQIARARAPGLVSHHPYRRRRTDSHSD